MIKTNIWPSEANNSQNQSSLAAKNIPENGTIAVAQRTSSGLWICTYARIQASDAQQLCRTLFESTHQLASVSAAQCIIENQGAVISNAADQKFNVIEGFLFYGEDFLIEEFSLFGHWIESTFDELDSVWLKPIEAISVQPFAIFVCN